MAIPKEIIEATASVQAARREYKKCIAATKDAYIKLSQTIIRLETVVEVIVEQESD